MPRIALVTARAARGTDYDMPALLKAFASLDVDAEEVNWDDPDHDWSRHDLALLRSPWDYVNRHAEFMAWAERTAEVTQLLNPLHVMRWNIDKHYLGALSNAGVAIVPSRFVEPGEDVATALTGFLATHPDAAECVIKPAVGAGSRDAQRHPRHAHAAMLAHLQRLLLANRSAMLQPYLARVDTVGETALIHFDSEFSHAIRKGPLLESGEDATAELYASEEVSPREAAHDERELARRALAAIPFPDSLAYARVDLIRDDDGTPRLLELELVEPSLFFDHSPGSAQHFALAVLKRTSRARPATR